MIKFGALTVRRELHNPPYLRLLSVLAVGYLIYYLWWRAATTFNPQALAFSWVLWLAEAFGAFTYLLFAWITRDTSPTREFRPPRPGLSVDILVPTFDEGSEILEATLVGCNQVSYPHRTYVLDDGRRPAIEQLASRLGCHYLTRESRAHAKAGNINAALPRTAGQFIVVLDADMVPQRDLLERTLGYFEDPRLAFIQMPQEFYNHDSIQHDPRAVLWHEQSLFFRVIQPGKNHSDSAFWCGSPSVVRRSALEDVGGVASSTITEDIHTSVRMHSRGWSSFFLAEPLAFGIAPQTIRAFLVQRLRWARGTMQLYASRESPLWLPGLSFRQRVSYLASFLAYFESFQKLVLIATPVLIVLSNTFPMRVDMLAFLARWVPYFVISLIANIAGGRGVFRYFQTEKYNLLKMVVFVQSTLTLLKSRTLKFEVTPKTVEASVYEGERRALRAYFLILGIIAGTVIYGLLNLVMGSSVVLGLQAYLVALFWALYNAVLILVGVAEVLRKPHNRLQYRFPVDVEAELIAAGGSALPGRVRIRDLSVSGVGFLIDPAAVQPGNSVSLSFYSAHGKPVTLAATRRHGRESSSAGETMIGASISNVDDRSRERLFEYLFVDVPETWRASLTSALRTRELMHEQRRARRPLPAGVPVEIPRTGS